MTRRPGRTWAEINLEEAEKLKIEKGDMLSHQVPYGVLIEAPLPAFPSDRPKGVVGLPSVRGTLL